MTQRTDRWDRRTFLRSAAWAAGLVGFPWQSALAEAPPETTTITLNQIPGVCVAPQYVAEELLRSEGFTGVRYAKYGTAGIYKALASGDVDLSMAFVAPFITQLDSDAAIVLIGGVHAGCFELFGTEGVRSIRALKGKTVAIPEFGSPHHVFTASMAAHVGLNPARDINFVIQPTEKSLQLLQEKKVDALMGFPPVPQELRSKNIGNVIVSSGMDRPWSQYFCCIVGANQGFVRKHPVAVKRALRAILKAANLCSLEPARAARLIADRGYQYEYVLQTMKEIPYGRWREYDPEDTVRFYALRLHEAGMIKSTPQKIIEKGTDWRFFNELKKEMKT
jgi:NitT/TauT family transport system substrate-binding protein